MQKLTQFVLGMFGLSTPEEVCHENTILAAIRGDETARQQVLVRENLVRRINNKELEAQFTAGEISARDFRMLPHLRTWEDLQAELDATPSDDEHPICQFFLPGLVPESVHGARAYRFAVA